MTNDFCNELLSELSPEERFLKFKSATLYGTLISIEFLVQEEDYFKVTDEFKGKVKKIATNILPDDVRVKINYIKSSPTKENIINKIIEYIFDEHKSIYPIFSQSEYYVEYEDVITVSVKLEKYLCDYAKGADLGTKIEEYLDNNFFESIEVAFLEIPNSEKDDIPIFVQHSSDIRIIEAKPMEVYQKGALSYPRYITDILKSEKELNNVTLCGVISDINYRRIVKENAKVKEKDFFTFLLNDTTDRIKCKFFARLKENFNWQDVIKDNACLIMNGTYKFDSYDNKFCFYVNAIASAEINFQSINLKSDFNRDLGKYCHVLPQPYYDLEQNDLFDLMNEYNDIDDKIYCVFDLETTGLSVESDEIIEIAAIKIVKGQFTEKFSTFVKPYEKIPLKITEITGISNDMVVDAPTASEVIPDFYRFTRGATLVGHNIASFDIPLLNAQAHKCKYNFDNLYEDTLILAKQKLNLSRNKLGDVCNALNIPLIGAHRAINDVAANAKVFLKLKKM